MTTPQQPQQCPKNWKPVSITVLKHGVLSSLVKTSGQRRARSTDDDEVGPVLAAQRSQKWHDIPYAALQLIALYKSESVNNILDIRLVCQRWHDAAVNYLPADAWRRFYDHLVKVHYQIPEKQIAKAKLPTPDTFQTYSHVARHWFFFTADSRALRESFRGVYFIPDSWKVQALGSVAEWYGVYVESGRVTNVQLTWKSFRGSVDLTKLPTGLRGLCLGDNKLSGSVDLTRLPAGLQNLSLDHNTLSGPVDLTLPIELQHLHLNNNQFSGSVDLTRLADGMVFLDLSRNQFSGSVDLTHLPASLVYLTLNANQFDGTVDLTKLPAGLQRLFLSDNKFSGSIDLTQLPGKMEQLWLHNNKFEGSTSVNNSKCELKVDDTVEIEK